jgi:hypothetical protein
MPALIPMIVLSHQFILDKSSWIKPLKIIAFVSLLLIIAARIYLVVDIGPDNSVKGRFRNKAWAKTIADKTGDIPVVFYNSYQRASLFWFYSGVPSHSHNWYGDRRSNYNFWPTESNLLGKPVFIADIYGISTFSDSVKTKKGWVALTMDPMYAALGGIRIIHEETAIVESTNLIHIKFSTQIPEQYRKFLQVNQNINTELVVGVFNGKELLKEYKTGITAQQLADQTSPSNVSFFIEDSGKASEVRFGIRSKNYLVTHNSEKILIPAF